MGKTKEDLIKELQELKGEEHLWELGWLVSDDKHVYQLLTSFKACSFKEACYRIVALMRYGARSLDEALTVLSKDDSTSIITGKPLKELTAEELLEDVKLNCRDVDGIWYLFSNESCYPIIDESDFFDRDFYEWLEDENLTFEDDLIVFCEDSWKKWSWRYHNNW